MENFTPEQAKLRMDELGIRTGALLVIIYGFISVAYIILSQVVAVEHRNLGLIAATIFYGSAVLLSILVGRDIKRIDDIVQMEYANKTVQRTSVVILNSSVGVAVVAYALLTDPTRMIIPLAVLACFGAAYAISYYTKLIRPHSFAARFRSAVGRGLLVAILIHLVWPKVLLLSIGVILGLLFVAWKNLRKDQAFYGWPDR